MVSLVLENWSNTKINDDSNEFDVLEIDNALLMSLLQDSPVKNGDDERLLSVIKSLEAEIDPHSVVMNMDDHISSVVEPTSEVYPEDCESSCAWQMNDQDCSISDDHDLKFSWINDVEMVSSPIGDEMNMWCMDSCGEELDNRSVEFGDYYYYSQQVFDHVVVPLEEPGYYTTSLWQQTYDSVMYG